MPGREKCSEGARRGRRSVQKGSRLLGPCVLWAESGSITRVRGDSDVHSTRGRTNSVAPCASWEGTGWREQLTGPSVRGVGS